MLWSSPMLGMEILTAAEFGTATLPPRARPPPPEGEPAAVPGADGFAPFPFALEGVGPCVDVLPAAGVAAVLGLVAPARRVALELPGDGDAADERPEVADDADDVDDAELAELLDDVGMTEADFTAESCPPPPHALSTATATAAPTYFPKVRFMPPV